MSLVIQSNSRRYTFDSLAKLRLLSGQKLKDNEAIEITGHTTEGDGGGGGWFWDASSTATDDDATIVKLADTTTGRVIRSDTDSMTPVMFGIANNVISIPSDFLTIQSALDSIARPPGTDVYEIKIDAGHDITYGFIVEGGDYSGFSITSADATVALDAGYAGIVSAPSGFTGFADHTLFAGLNCVMPNLNAKFDMANVTFDAGVNGGDGLYLKNSSIAIGQGFGVINASLRGIQARERSSVDGTLCNFSGAAANGIKAQHGAICALNSADFSNCCSNVALGPEANTHTAAIYFSKGCVASCLNADVSGSGANGLEIRRSWIHAEGIDASACTGDPNQTPKGAVVNISGVLECRVADLSGCVNGSSIYASDGGYSIVQGCEMDTNGINSVRALASSIVMADGCRMFGNTGDDIHSDQGSTVSLNESETSNSSSQTSGTLITTDLITRRGGVYRISAFVAGDDFTNVGAASNATGVLFRATGATPTTWTNGSTLVLQKPAIADVGTISGGAISSFNSINPYGTIKCNQYNQDGWIEFAPTLVDQSGNDVSANGGSYIAQFGRYRFVDRNMVELRIQVQAVKGGDVVAGDRIVIPEASMGYAITLPFTQFAPAAIIGSGITLTGAESTVVAELQTNGDIFFAGNGSAVSSSLLWSDFGTAGLSFNTKLNIS